MKAVTVANGRLEWREHPDPEPGAGELLIDVRAAGLNSADMLQRKGLYPAPPGSPPDIPGMELAGEVVALGRDVERFSVGDRVMALVGGGGQAELALAHERVTIPVPDALMWPEAGGFPEVFTTAHDALFTQCALRLGEHALVHAAAGGVGIAGVQLAALAGARVTATVRNPDLRHDVAAIGTRAGRTEVVAPDAFVEHGPFDVVLELIGEPNIASDLDALAVGGRVVVIGVGGGAGAEVNLLTLMAKRGRIHASTLRARPLEEKARAVQLVEAKVLTFLRDEESILQVPVAATFPMSEAEAAYDQFVAGGKLGKLVLIRDVASSTPTT
jgi:NADPH2:quinone reductase